MKLNVFSVFYLNLENPQTCPNPSSIWQRFLRTPLSGSPTELAQALLWILLGILKFVVFKEYF